MHTYKNKTLITVKYEDYYSTYYFKKSNEIILKTAISRNMLIFKLLPVNIFELQHQVHISFILISSFIAVTRGEEGQPQQFLFRTTFSSFSRPNHL